MYIFIIGIEVNNFLVEKKRYIYMFQDFKDKDVDKGIIFRCCDFSFLRKKIFVERESGLKRY